jgi:hypothetical protein
MKRVEVPTGTPADVERFVGRTWVEQSSSEWVQTLHLRLERAHEAGAGVEYRAPRSLSTEAKSEPPCAEVESGPLRGWFAGQVVPAIVLFGHLTGTSPILVYRVDVYTAAIGQGARTRCRITGARGPASSVRELNKAQPLPPAQRASS